MKWVGENIARIGEKFDRIFKTNLCMSCINMKFKHTEETEFLDKVKNAERALNERAGKWSYHIFSKHCDEFYCCLRCCDFGLYKNSLVNDSGNYFVCSEFIY